MRAIVKLLALVALAGAAGCHRAQPPGVSITPIQSAANGHALAPGLWVERVSDRNGAQISKICLDAASAAAFASMDLDLAGRCRHHAMAQAADGSWHFSTSCDMGHGGQVATEGVIRGDFASHYTVETRSLTAGARNAAADGPNRVLADVRRVGECPANMKPGDVVLPNGAHTRLSDMSRRA